jgi:hypothetical protein
LTSCYLTEYYCVTEYSTLSKSISADLSFSVG